MANLTLAITEDLKRKMASFPEINWSEVARQAIAEKTEVLGQMQTLLAKSKLKEEESIALGREIKKRAWKHH